MTPSLDTRPEPDFRRGHLPRAVNIPVEQLPTRVHELPDSSTPISLYDPDPTRLATAQHFLTTRGHPVHILTPAPTDLTEAGGSRARLWSPNPFLEQILPLLDPTLPKTATDVACGTGRDSVFLALHGYSVTAIDHLPDAISRAIALAARYDLSVHGVVHDLESTLTIPAPPASLVCVFRYLHRPLFPALRNAVAPGGYLACETFHTSNLQTNRPPRNPNHLLQSDELRTLFADWQILLSADAVERNGRFFSHLLARRPA